MHFYDWVTSSQKGKNNLFGDFARDAEEDPTFPKQTSDYINIYSHLIQKGASGAAKETFIRLFVAYAMEARLERKIYSQALKDLREFTS